MVVIGIGHWSFSGLTFGAVGIATGHCLGDCQWSLSGLPLAVAGMAFDRCREYHWSSSGLPLVVVSIATGRCRGCRWSLLGLPMSLLKLPLAVVGIITSDLSLSLAARIPVACTKKATS